MKDMNLTTQVAGWTRIDETLAFHAQRSPDAPCASFEGRHWNWVEFNSLVDSNARALSACGVAAGDRIALLSTLRPEYLTVLMAASRIGAIYVRLNPRYKAAEVAEAVMRAGPSLIITLRSFEGQDFPELINAAVATVALPPVVRFRQRGELSGCLAVTAGSAAVRHRRVADADRSVRRGGLRLHFRLHWAT